jgi:peptidyl-tRNA hydrolase
MYTLEELEHTKGVIRIRTSKKNRQHNGQMKSTNNDLQNIHIKLKIV